MRCEIEHMQKRFFNYKKIVMYNSMLMNLNNFIKINKFFRKNIIAISTQEEVETRNN